MSNEIIFVLTKCYVFSQNLVEKLSKNAEFDLNICCGCD